MARAVEVDLPEFTAPRAAPPWRRWVLFALGWLFFALGLVGVFLPVLPTTPFMIVALWCFSGSSQRFHRWLFNHRLFGPPLQRWQRERVIPLPVKLVASGAMLISLGYVVLSTQAPWYACAAMAAVMAYGAWFIWRQPSRGALSSRHRSQ
jgi:hypothetical protein